METGLDPPRAMALRAMERDALAAVRRVIVTSATTARLVAELGVTAERCRVVEPGTDPAPLAEGSRGGPIRLLCVGALTRRKGHALLLQALAGLSAPDWRLSCIGSPDRDPETVVRLRRLIVELGLGGRVRLCGALPAPALAAAWREADLFVLASLFEGYGMAYAEAMARGLPVLGTSAGAIPGTVPAEAGLLVEPGSVSALRLALERLLGDAALRARLAAGARRARRRLPDWPASARRMAEALRL